MTDDLTAALQRRHAEALEAARAEGYEAGFSSGVDAGTDIPSVSHLTDEALADANRLHDVIHVSAPGGLFEAERNPSGCDRFWCLQTVPELTAVAEGRIRADERKKAATRIVAHADRHAPADGNAAQRWMRRHLLTAARVAVGPMTMEQVAEALEAGDYMVCQVDEDGRAAGEGERDAG